MLKTEKLTSQVKSKITKIQQKNQTLNLLIRKNQTPIRKTEIFSNCKTVNHKSTKVLFVRKNITYKNHHCHLNKFDSINESEIFSLNVRNEFFYRDFENQQNSAA